MKKCLIITGGEYAPLPNDLKYEFVIACDKGLEYAKKEKITPDLLIGDFDSYEGAVPENISVMRLKREKDDTDTMVAVKYALEHGFDSISVACALGGRFDHTYANIQSAVYAVKNGAKMSLYGRDCEMDLLSDEKRCFPRKKGYFISLFSVSELCCDVCVSGAKYRLDGEVLTSSFPLGVSNEWASDIVEVSVGEGILMVVQTKG